MEDALKFMGATPINYRGTVSKVISADRGLFLLHDTVLLIIERGFITEKLPLKITEEVTLLFVNVLLIQTPRWLSKESENSLHINHYCLIATKDTKIYFIKIPSESTHIDLHVENKPLDSTYQLTPVEYLHMFKLAYYMYAVAGTSCLEIYFPLSILQLAFSKALWRWLFPILKRDIGTHTRPFICQGSSINSPFTDEKKLDDLRYLIRSIGSKMLLPISAAICRPNETVAVIGIVKIDNNDVFMITDPNIQVPFLSTVPHTDLNLYDGCLLIFTQCVCIQTRISQNKHLILTRKEDLLIHPRTPIFHKNQIVILARSINNVISGKTGIWSRYLHFSVNNGKVHVARFSKRRYATLIKTPAIFIIDKPITNSMTNDNTLVITNSRFISINLNGDKFTSNIPSHFYDNLVCELHEAHQKRPLYTPAQLLKSNALVTPVNVKGILREINYNIENIPRLKIYDPDGYNYIECDFYGGKKDIFSQIYQVANQNSGYVIYIQFTHIYGTNHIYRDCSKTEIHLWYDEECLNMTPKIVPELQNIIEYYYESIFSTKLVSQFFIWVLEIYELWPIIRIKFTDGTALAYGTIDRKILHQTLCSQSSNAKDDHMLKNWLLKFDLIIYGRRVISTKVYGDAAKIKYKQRFTQASLVMINNREVMLTSREIIELEILYLKQVTIGDLNIKV